MPPIAESLVSAQELDTIIAYLAHPVAGGPGAGQPARPPASSHGAASARSNEILGPIWESLESQKWHACDRSTLDRVGGLRSERGHH